MLAVEDVSLGAPNAYEQIRKRLLEVRETDGFIRVTVLRAGERLELFGALNP